MLKAKYLNEMVEEQKQKLCAHERHMEKTKTEQGKWKSQKKISLQLCNIKFRKNTFTGSQNVTSRWTDRANVIGTFLQDLSLQICQMGVCSLNNGKRCTCNIFSSVA